MEADWEVEIGPNAPVIEAHWPGFVDLRRTPEKAAELPESVQLPGLAEALVRLNRHGSPVWTSKCDLWKVPIAQGSQAGGDEFRADPYELDAPPEIALHACACYIDLLSRSDQQWIVPEMAVASCKSVCARLHSVPLRGCRVDLVVRRAAVTPNLDDLGITAYLTACGPTEMDAKRTLQVALAAFTDALCPISTLE